MILYTSLNISYIKNFILGTTGSSVFKKGAVHINHDNLTFRPHVRESFNMRGKLFSYLVSRVYDINPVSIKLTSLVSNSEG